MCSFSQQYVHCKFFSLLVLCGRTEHMINLAVCSLEIKLEEALPADQNNTPGGVWG